MKNVVLVLSAAWAIIITAEYAILKDEMQIQAERYETRLEVQEMEYRDELIEVQEEHQMDKNELSKVRQELRGKQFEFDITQRTWGVESTVPRIQHGLRGWPLEVKGKVLIFQTQRDSSRNMRQRFHRHTVERHVNHI